MAWKEDVAYFECICEDFQHAFRLKYLDDNDEPKWREFYLEFGLGKFPHTQTDNDQGYYQFGNGKIKDFLTKWRMKKDAFKRYIRNIKWSILGRPIWFSACGSLEPEEAKKMAEFILKNTKE
jgi:hypothetical protein